MPAPRSKSISTKVTEEEYAQFEALAGAQTISEWARDILLRAASPTPAEQTIVAELLALRVILLNTFYKLAQGEKLTADEMQAIIERADASKGKKAVDRLAAAAERSNALLPH